MNDSFQPLQVCDSVILAGAAGLLEAIHFCRSLTAEVSVIRCYPSLNLRTSETISWKLTARQCWVRTVPGEGRQGKCAGS